MNTATLQRLGQWTTLLTLLTGIILTGSYVVTRNVEAGTFLYFYLIFSGIVNAGVFVLLLLFSFSSRYKQSLLITAILVALSYSALLATSCFIL